jgi:hypothetical protein
MERFVPHHISAMKSRKVSGTKHGLRKQKQLRPKSFKRTVVDLCRGGRILLQRTLKVHYAREWTGLICWSWLEYYALIIITQSVLAPFLWAGQYQTPSTAETALPYSKCNPWVWECFFHLSVDSKGLQRWCTPLKITAFVESVNRRVF